MTPFHGWKQFIRSFPESKDTAFSPEIRRYIHHRIFSPYEENVILNRFHEIRLQLSLLLSHYPQLLVLQIPLWRANRYLTLDQGGELIEESMEQQQKRIETLLNQLDGIIEFLVQIVPEELEKWKEQTSSYYHSLELLFRSFLFPFDWYVQFVQSLQQYVDKEIPEAKLPCVDILGILMPENYFQMELDKISLLLGELRDLRDRVIENNLFLVYRLAKRYTRYGLALEDLFQEGVMGLCYAIDRFLPQKKYRFSTYAVWWIRQGMTLALSNHSRTIRLPANISRLLIQIREAELQLFHELGKEPQPEDIAERIGQPVQRVRAWLKMQQQPISFHFSSDGVDDVSIEEQICDENARLPRDVVGVSLIHESLERALSALSPREQEIIRLRFGLAGSRAQTLKELSQYFGVSHERIRQIESVALKKLRSLLFQRSRE